MRRGLTIAGIVIVVVLAGAVAALEVLKSGVGKDRIALALSNALGAPVQIASLSIAILPTPALEATGVRIGGAAADAAPGVSVQALRIAPSLLSLLPGRTPTVRRADLVGLVIAIRHTASGQWLAPIPPAVASGSQHATPGAPSTARPDPGAPAPVAIDALHIQGGAVRVVDDHIHSSAGGSTTTTIVGIDAALTYVDGTLSVPAFTGRLGQTVVTGSAEAGPRGITLHLASRSLHDADLPSLFALAGMAPMSDLSIGGRAPVDITTHVAADFTTMTVSGLVSFEQVRFGRLALQSLRAPFRLTGNVFTIDPLTFTAYAGHETGRVSVNIAAFPMVYTLRTSLDHLDVNQALSSTTTMKNFMFGVGQVSADVTGSGTTQAAIERTLGGTARFAVSDGSIRNFPIISTIDRALGTSTASANDTKFQSLSATAVIGNGQAKTSDLTLLAGDASLLGSGTYGFDQAINMRLTARLSASKTAQLAQRVGLVTRLESKQGTLDIPVTVTGTATSPKIDANLQSVAKQQITGVLQGLLKKH